MTFRNCLFTFWLTLVLGSCAVLTTRTVKPDGTVIVDTKIVFDYYTNEFMYDSPKRQEVSYQ